MDQYRIKPGNVVAMQYMGGVQSADRVIAWAIRLGAGPGMRYVRLGNTLDIKSVAGVTLCAEAEDWIVHNIETGSFFPCRPDIFESFYERLENSVTDA